MTGPLPITRLTIHQLNIPLRRAFEHAAASRDASEPLILAVQLADGTLGHGETHPRPYVSGESLESAVRAIRELFLPMLVEMRPRNFGEAIAAVDSLPLREAAGNVVTAARCAVELALLDAYSRAFDRSIEHLAGYIAEVGLGPPGSRATVRYSGVLSGASPRRAVSSLRKMRLFGLRDFKLKVGDADDDARLNAVARGLGRSLTRGRVSLRLDANGAWTLDEAKARLRAWESLPIAAVEQPLPAGSFHDWAALAVATNLPLMADESLVTPEDAAGLIERRAASAFNIRISKNGGLLPAMRLALLARKHNLDIQLGCMVGETSILSAAGRWFLQLVPGVRFVEGSFGQFLLRGDVSRRSLRFGWGGRWRPMVGPGLGIEVSTDFLIQHATDQPIELPL